MHNVKSMRNICIVLFFSIPLSFLQAQINPAEKLPVDKEVTIGKLSNGLTYYIRPNSRPEKKVELRLVVNAGSINEDEDQLGLAHMTEHMAFNGTKHFKKNDIVSFLQKIGVGFGSDLNAYTSFDETVYILPIPTDSAGNVEKGFSVLEDWAHNVTFLDDDIDNERPIILEESRLRKGANDRMFNKLFPEWYKGSLYAQRLPIGKDSIIKNFRYNTIRRFYKDWYRPDLMAVIVVGDITREKALALVKKHFESIPAVSNPRPRKDATVPPYTESNAIVITDKEATSFQGYIDYPSYVTEKTLTYGDYRKELIKDLFIAMLNKRLQEQTQKENPPFVYGMSSFTGYARHHENFELMVVSGDKEPSDAIKAGVEELERVKRFGFTAPELERARLNMLAAYEKSYNDRDKMESANFVEEYKKHFLEQTPVPGIAAEYGMVKAFLPAIRLEDINAVASFLKNDQHIFAAIMGPEKEGVTLPAPKALLQEIAQASKAEVTPYEAKAIATHLLPATPKPGKIIGQKADAVTSTKELTLSNGITVTLKKTDFKNDEILLSASRYGGTSNYGLPDKYNAAYAIPAINAMGFGSFSPMDLQNALAGKSISVSPSLSGTTDGLSGSSTVKDMETFFQLIYLKMTSPRIDSSLFNAFLQKNKSQLALLGSNPQATFIDTALRVFYNNHPLAPIQVPRASFFDSVQMNRVIGIYKERFGNAKGFHFVFTGNFNEQEILPLIETYIAGLPATTKVSHFVDQKVRPIQGQKELTIYKGEEPKSLILSIYSGSIPYSEDLELKADVLSEILNIRIIEKLREEIQGIYGGGTFSNLRKVPYASFQFIVQLPCGPEKVDTLLKALHAEIRQIIENGPKQEDLSKVRQQLLESNNQSLKENTAWSSHLLASRMEGKNIDRFIHFEKYIDKITVKDIQETAQLLLNGKNDYTAILMPAKEEKK